MVGVASAEVVAGLGLRLPSAAFLLELSVGWGWGGPGRVEWFTLAVVSDLLTASRPKRPNKGKSDWLFHLTAPQPERRGRIPGSCPPSPDRRARPAKRGHDDEFGLAERRQSSVGADRDRPFRSETRRLRADTEAAQNGADQPGQRAAGAGDAPGDIRFLERRQNRLAGDAARRIEDERQRPLRVPPPVRRRDPDHLLAPHMRPRPSPARRLAKMRSSAPSSMPE